MLYILKRTFIFGSLPLNTEIDVCALGIEHCTFAFSNFYSHSGFFYPYKSYIKTRFLPSSSAID